MASEHASPLHSSLLLDHAGSGAPRESYDAPFGMPSSSPGGMSDPFGNVPIFPSLGLDTLQHEPPMQHTPFGAQSTSMLWQDVRQPVSESGAWPSYTYDPHGVLSAHPQGGAAPPPAPPLGRRGSEMLPSGVAEMRLDTTSSQHTRPSVDSVSSQDTINEASARGPAPDAHGRSIPSMPMTPMRPTTTGASSTTAPRSMYDDSRTNISPPVSSLDDDTPMKSTTDASSADDTFRGSFLYELNATPPAMLAQGMPPMTPLTDARGGARDDAHQHPGSARMHRSGPSIGSSSALSATPEYGSAHSIASSADLRSPGFPLDGTQVDMSPHRAATLPYGATELYGALHGHGAQFPPHMPFQAHPATPMQQRGSAPGAFKLDEPFGTPEQFMSPHAPAPPLTMSPGLLYFDQHTPDPKMIGRTASAPTLYPTGMPSWPSEHDLGMYTPTQEPMSFPASPASVGTSLPVNSTAMARKCFTPYAKASPSPLLYGSPLEMDPYFGPNGMPTSKSMTALSSPGPMSPLASSARGRRRSQLTESISMPGDQMASLLDLDMTQTAVRARGRNAGPPPLVVSSADKLHVCHCGRRFKRMEHLKRHNRTHTQERPHKCPVESCGKSFGRSDNLAQHLKTHYRPAGLVGRASELLQTERPESAQLRDRRHEPHAAAAAAASAAAASAALATPPGRVREASAEAASV
ncbi:hypothetical protein GLX27_001076 [Malassezia furfur]|uniref:C2H2-type domain-containing protein n=1 Tax=Malassezia furfur TaxID=55194 RepID=A0ABY8ELM0_MALFU|nr:hypothetical protein CBS14141_001263 [Malassezia furfur]WFD46441.1 hypothetical protein GLX27_001076 [Malassezia furfur]